MTLAALCLLAGACTPSASTQPTATPTPMPASTPTPTENAIERQQRLDFAASEKSYREFRAEYGRVLARGGASEATTTMKSTAGGVYLSSYVDVIRGYEQRKYHRTGTFTIVYVRPVGHSDKRLVLDACEDGRRTRTLDAKQVEIGTGELRTVRLEVRRSDGRWKVWSADGNKVTTCE